MRGLGSGRGCGVAHTLTFTWSLTGRKLVMNSRAFSHLHMVSRPPMVADMHTICGPAPAAGWATPREEALPAAGCCCCCRDASDRCRFCCVMSFDRESYICTTCGRGRALKLDLTETPPTESLSVLCYYPTKFLLVFSLNRSCGEVTRAVFSPQGAAPSPDQ